MTAHFILYVNDQRRSTVFYEWRCNSPQSLMCQA